MSSILVNFVELPPSLHWGNVNETCRYSYQGEFIGKMVISTVVKEMVIFEKEIIVWELVKSKVFPVK